jgi:CheY-like chemotaxis protein
MNPSDTTILVADDQPVVLDTVRDGLIGHGYQVLSATGETKRFKSRKLTEVRSRWPWSTSSCPPSAGPKQSNVVVHDVSRGRSVAGQAVQPRHARTQGPRHPQLPLPVLASLATAALIRNVFSLVSVTCSGMARLTLHHLTSLRRHRKVVYSGGQRATAERALIGGHRN